VSSFKNVLKGKYAWLRRNCTPIYEKRRTKTIIVLSSKSKIVSKVDKSANLRNDRYLRKPSPLTQQFRIKREVNVTVQSNTVGDENGISKCLAFVAKRSRFRVVTSEKETDRLVRRIRTPRRFWSGFTFRIRKQRRLCSKNDSESDAGRDSFGVINEPDKSVFKLNCRIKAENVSTRRDSNGETAIETVRTGEKRKTNRSRRRS